LKSHNGVYLNGHKITEALLKEGDVIQAGETVLVYTAKDITDRTDALQYFKQASRRLRDDPTITDRPDS
ncbi:MAG: FHA domain-containing protein, partial [Planctomycetota bacterium]